MKQARHIAGAAIWLALAAAAAASPTGTPQSNRPPLGTPKPLSLRFFGGSERADKARAAADPAQPASRRLTQAEWRAAYIAKHHHDITAPVHPGH